jgi:hypothetical protein
MKLKILWWGWVIAILVAITAVWLMCGLPPKPFQVEYVPTNLSKDWLTYTDEVMGIEIKYPSNAWSWTQGKGPGGGYDVKFVAPNGGEFTINCHEGVPQSYEYTGWKTKINGLEARWNKYDQLIWASTAARHEEKCVLQHGNSTYTIWWTRFDDDFKENYYPKNVHPDFHEMIGTFRFRERKLSDSRKYEDQTYHYSFTYPTAWGWRLNCGGGNVSVTDGAKFSLSIDVVSHSTFAAEQRKWPDSFSKVGDEQELFEQRLVGRRFLSHGADSYAFEKNGNLFMVTIRVHPQFGLEPEPVITDLLNSLSL